MRRLFVLGQVVFISAALLLPFCLRHQSWGQNVGASADTPAADPARILDCLPVREAPFWPSLARGRWVLILRNATCGHCGPLLEEYGENALRWQAAGKPWRVAVITISEGASAFEPPQSPLPRPVFTGTVANPQSAFLVSPTLLLVAEGRVLKGWEGAVDCQWSEAKEALLNAK